MKKYSLLLSVFCMLIIMVFVQCKNPKTDDTPIRTEVDTTVSVVPSQEEMLIDSADAIVIDTPKTNTEKPKTIVVDKTPTIDKPKKTVIVKPETKENPTKPVVTDKPAPVIVDKPEETPVEKPAEPVTAPFSMKSVKATIVGTSSLHEWESNITLIDGKGTFLLKDNMITSIKDAVIKITVKGIISEKGEKMDKKTYETFNADAHPYITYSFNNAVVKINDFQNVTMDTNGSLTMAGVSKLVPISATGKKLPNGDLHLTVSKKLKMTDFGMEPPVMFLGTIKVGDEVTVNFDFILSKN